MPRTTESVRRGSSVAWAVCFALAAWAALAARFEAQGADLVAQSYPPVVAGSCFSMTTDISGNCYLTGQFSGTLDFNPMVGEDSKTSVGATDCFVTKYNFDGSYAWTQTFGGTGDDGGVGIAVSNGVVYVCGQFNSADAGGGGIGTYASSGAYDAFILALNASNGSLVWFQKFGGTSNDYGKAIAVSGSTVYALTVFTSGDAGVGGTGALSSSGFMDACVVALNANNGSSVWTQKLGGGQSDYGNCIAVSESTVYVGGQFLSGDFGVGGPGAFSSSGGWDAFVAALSGADGSPLWLQKFGGSGTDLGLGITVTGSSVYFVGNFVGTDAGVGGLGSVASSGASDGFVLALNASNGSQQWVQTFGGTGTDDCSRVAVSGSTVYVAGNTASTDAGFGGLGTLGTSGLNDVAVMALNLANGSPGWLQKFGGTADDTVGGLAVVGSTVLVAGPSASTDAGVGGTGTFNSTGFGGFLLRLDSTTGAMVGLPPPNRPPTITSATATVESAQVEVVAVGREALFVAAATDPDNNPLTYAWDFGDGGVAVGAQAPHAFTVPGSLVVTVRVSDGLATATSSFTMTVLAPSSGGGGVTNISQDNGTVVANPLNSVKVSVANSIGAVIELFVDLQALVREDFTVETSFELPSRQAFPLAHGVRPVVKFEHHGLGVASSNVTRVSTGQTEGKARKMLAVSVLETDDGELPKLPKPSSSFITLKSLKGKFNFSGTNDAKPDAVSVSGTIKLPAGLELTQDQELWIGAGNVVERVLLDRRGNAKDKSTGDSGRIKKAKVKWPRLPKGVTATTGDEVATVSVTFMLPDMDTIGFDTEGVTNTLRPDEAGKTSVRRQIQVGLVLAGVSYEALAPADFKLSKKMDSGQLKLPSRAGQ